ncbi:MAG TPA: LLM class flavin-dependent oxidoreductase [Acidimicrobiales bacterium]|nr:LLM class flavin-dependent oxidoreductase [Acidimicrobiales bacterium]
MGVRYGLYVAPFSELASPHELCGLAVTAEAAGFDGFFVWDHVLRPQLGLAVADPWVALAAVACATSSVRLGALVTPLTRRRPHKVAREVVTLDHLSRGRVIVGVGLGVDTGGELSRFGEALEPSVRADRLDEALALLRRYWSGEVVHHRGEYFQADGVQLLPRPVNGQVPVWVAARGPVPRAMRRAAGNDGLFPDRVSPEALKEMLSLVAAARGSLDGFDVVAKGPPGDDPAPWLEAGATWWLVAPPADMALAEVREVARRGPPSPGTT